MMRGCPVLRLRLPKLVINVRSLLKWTAVVLGGLAAYALLWLVLALR